MALKRRLKQAAAMSMTALALALLALTAGSFPRAGAVSAGDDGGFADLPPYEWTQIELSDETQCSDGSDYHIYARRGESDNLIVHFNGGGACWNDETCTQPITITNFSGYYFSYIWEIFHVIADGIFQSGSADNLFRDWNVVTIPYCTADLHIGAAAETFSLDGGKPRAIAFNGRQNVTEALDWVFAQFDDPPRLLVSGESAGAFGSTFWTPAIADHYPDSDVYHLADGSFLQTDRWAEIVDQVWNADFETNFGFTPGADLVGSAYRHYSENPPPNVTFLHLNTVYDGTLIYFDAELNGVPNDAAHRDLWSQELRAATKANAESGLSYFYYLTDFGLDAQTGTTPHTSLSSALFYAVQENDIFLRDWLRRVVLDGERFSVGGALLDE